jgi:ABC-type siderophore export system fused ATPase/permease subunit
MFSVLSAAGTTAYYNFLSGTMITLFVVALVVIFVYEYEVLRRPKNQS